MHNLYVGVESTHEDFVCGVGEVHDMCETWSEEVRRGVVELEYYDGQTWKKLGPKLGELGERAELHRFKKMGVYECVSREAVRRDPIGRTARVKWARVNKGSEDSPEVQHRLVAQ